MWFCQLLFPGVLAFRRLPTESKGFLRGPGVHGNIKTCLPHCNDAEHEARCKYIGRSCSNYISVCLSILELEGLHSWLFSAAFLLHSISYSCVIWTRGPRPSPQQGFSNSFQGIYVISQRPPLSPAHSTALRLSCICRRKESKVQNLCKACGKVPLLSAASSAVLLDLPC